eukprot:m.124601 g.124601  ORF g.124601 m.124601 type:complete len:489 (+) comp29066_c0_seq3:214-1680(+)
MASKAVAVVGHVKEALSLFGPLVAKSSRWHPHIAGRLPAGTIYPVVVSKNGPNHIHLLPDGTTKEVLVVGGACSEVFSGPRLAKLLRPSYELERHALTQLELGEFAPTLSIYTSTGASPALPKFLNALEQHLPWHSSTVATSKEDWFVSLQLEGASAVWAACDLLLQKHHTSATTLESTRLKVAVGDSSYHGPPMSSLGGKTPLGANAKPLQLKYPVPTIFARHVGEHDDEFHDRKHTEFVNFLNEHENEIGVMLIEPQWGSSVAAQPWPPQLLRRYIESARERGIFVCADEIMCGLGRHGQGTTFLSEAWELNVDAVTFGKAVAAGIEPLSGAIIKCGSAALGDSGRSALQSHTYSASSSRALTTAACVLDALPSHRLHIADMHSVCEDVFNQVTIASNHTLHIHGQGLMWGGVFHLNDADLRQRASEIFRTQCVNNNVVLYTIPLGGFMFTPLLDITEEQIREAGRRMCIAAEQTVHQMCIQRLGF